MNLSSKIFIFLFFLLSSFAALAQQNCEITKCSGFDCSAGNFVVRDVRGRIISINHYGGDEHYYYVDALENYKTLIESKKCQVTTKLSCRITKCNGYDCPAGNFVVRDHNDFILRDYHGLQAQAEKELNQLELKGICISETIFNIKSSK